MSDFKFSIHQRVLLAVGQGNHVPDFYKATILNRHTTSKNLYTIRTEKELYFLTSLLGFSKQIFIVEEEILGEYSE